MITDLVSLFHHIRYDVSEIDIKNGTISVDKIVLHIVTGLTYRFFSIGLKIGKLIKQEYQDKTDRIEVERTFSLSKRCYGMSCITTKLEETQLTSIALSVFVTNLFRIQRRILYALLHLFRFWHDWNRFKSWKLWISA